jgi:hypothetical protein
MTSVSGVEVKKAWICALTHPFYFMACAGTVLPAVLYSFISQRTLLCRRVLAVIRSGVGAGLF